MRLGVALLVALVGFAAGAGVVAATHRTASVATQAVLSGIAHSNDSDDWP